MNTAPPQGLFISATGTDAGKTAVAIALCHALGRAGQSVCAVKPVETGCTPDPLDARALAAACGRPELADAPGLYRVAPPLAPYAATLGGAPPPPGPDALASRTRACARDGDFLLVEGAGGLRVPLDPHHDMADLARALALPVLLVAPDRLGVLSYALTALQSAGAAGLRVCALILNAHLRDDTDPSSDTNARILAERADVPVIAFPRLPPDADDSARADAVPQALLRLLSPS